MGDSLFKDNTNIFADMINSSTQNMIENLRQDYSYLYDTYSSLGVGLIVNDAYSNLKTSIESMQKINTDIIKNTLTTDFKSINESISYSLNSSLRQSMIDISSINSFGLLEEDISKLLNEPLISIKNSYESYNQLYNTALYQFGNNTTFLENELGADSLPNVIKKYPIDHLAEKSDEILSNIKFRDAQSNKQFWYGVLLSLALYSLDKCEQKPSIIINTKPTIINNTQIFIIQNTQVSFDSDKMEERNGK